MKLHELRPAVGGGTKAKKRLGRGTATGQGKTSGRGQALVPAVELDRDLKGVKCL